MFYTVSMEVQKHNIMKCYANSTRFIIRVEMEYK